MKGDKKKLKIGPILVILGIALYNLLKDRNVICIVFVILIMLLVYSLYRLNKHGKAKLEENIIVVIGIILMLIGILDQVFYDSFIKYYLNFTVIPIIVFTLLTVIFACIIIDAWRSGDKARAKKLTILTIITVILMVMMTVLGIIWS
ncbi:MAG: hypothetical protein RR636_06745 [Clostridium sp.]|uniref:hypothetical protein n=1 Tax=Clostridium sp. TaxID=1506 RepID=UPI0030289E4A